MTTTTLLRLNPQHHLTQSALTNPQTAHVLVLKGFAHHAETPNAALRSEQNVLFATHLHESGEARIMVQSDSPGKWEDETLLEALIDPPQTTPAPQTPDNGTNIAYRLRFNPVRKHGKKITAITEPGAAVSWFTDRAAQYGLQLNAEPRLLGQDKFVHKTKGFSVCTTEIMGTATITNSNAFHRAARKGIGRSRAYGCGLLLFRAV